MSKVKIVILTLLAVLLTSLTGAWVAQAQQFRSGDAVSVTNGEKVDGSLYVAGKTVTIDADVNGDVYCAGQTVTVIGTVHGDVICAAQTLTVKGKVEGDVRLAGQVVSLDANVAKNATVAAQTFVLEQTGNIGGDVTVASSEATLKGKVGRDVVAGTESLTLAGVVGRNVSSDSTNTKLTGEARIAGNVTYTSFNTLGQTEGAVISGQVTRNDPPADRKQADNSFGHVLGKLVYWFVAFLLVALALVLLFPRMFQTVSDRAFPMPWWALLAGLGAMLAMPLVLVLLALTFVGLPLMVVVLVLWIGVALLSGPVFSYYVGRLVLPNRTPLLTMLAGASIVIIASFIPYLSILVFIATAWLGSGMLVLEIFRRVSTSRLQTVSAKPKKPSKAAA